MGGHPEGEVAVAARAADPRGAVPARRQADADRPAALPARRDHRRPPPAPALRHREGADRHAAHDRRRLLLQGNAAYWAHCGDSRLYLVRGDKLIARTRDHSYSELQETMSQVVPMGDRFNRNVLFTCLGVPASRWSTPPARCCCRPGDRMLLCSDGLWGSGQRQRDHRAAGAAAALRRGARAGRAGAAQRRRQERQRHRARASSGKAPRTPTSGRGVSTDSARRRGVRLDHPGQRARRQTRRRRARRRRDRALDRARSTKRSSARRSKKR